MTAPPLPASQLDHRWHEFVSEELARLARRAPSLGDDHLRLVEMSLHQIIDRLLPARAAARPETLIALFDLEGPR